MSFQSKTKERKRYKLVGCEIFFRELCAAAARTPHCIDLEFLPKGLHDLETGEMLERVQTAVDRAEPERHDAVLLGYGLCNNGLVGVRAKEVELVLPRAHDCITLFLGSRRRYREYFDAHPGSYYLTSGWLERGHGGGGDLEDLSIQSKLGLNMAYEELVEQYGEDNAQYLWETLGDATPHYELFTYIETGVPDEKRFVEEGRRLAEEKGWSFEHLEGDPNLLERLVCGHWDEEDFLRVPPGHKVRATHDDRIVEAVPE
ncbi:DUF1638 domain-containing protein [Kiritimatiella glycovorans]|uniref:DUF1638 domain-containing protein n=1 Tax=Kiritimatiella glycovorans TaxID=1307763 RepID=A0A0G3EE01_9BACT|nr:DUF1638 domain-containing protein [Kiritimatiella glycovorans]AKJ64686.1 hypothetical protein L21SP4_01440 [Kiritimatiella glycovorans]